jgi:hypothetical protein
VRSKLLEYELVPPQFKRGMTKGSKVSSLDSRR